MSKIKIMTDSSVQLSPEEIEKYGITVVPLSVTIDGHTYTDGVDMRQRSCPRPASPRSACSWREWRN